MSEYRDVLERTRSRFQVPALPLEEVATPGTTTIGSGLAAMASSQAGSSAARWSEVG